MDTYWVPSGLREVVESTTFLPLWEIYLGHENESDGWLTLHIISFTSNNYEQNKTMRVKHSFLVPMATYNDRTWKAWVSDCYEKNS